MFDNLRKFLKVYPLPIFVLLLIFGMYYSVFEAVNKTSKDGVAITQEESMLENALQNEQTLEQAQETLPQIPQEQETQIPQIAQNIPQEPALEPQEEIKPLPEPKLSFVTSKVASLNIRQTPATTAQVVGKLTPKQQAIILDRQNGWLKIADLDSKELGWILEQYSNEVVAQDEPIQAQTQPTPQQPQQAQLQQEFSVKLRVNIREIPSTDGNIIGKLLPQDSVIIIEEKDGWARIQSTDGAKSGFVIRRSLSAIN